MMYPMNNGKQSGLLPLASGGDVYRRLQQDPEADDRSISSTSNETDADEYHSLIDETCRKSSKGGYEQQRAGGSRASRTVPSTGGNNCSRNRVFLVIIAMFSFITLLLTAVPLGGDKGRVGTIAGWSANTSRLTVNYVLPAENTTIIDPLNICTTEERTGDGSENEKVFLLIVVCSSAKNFEARQTIRETWGNVSEFNYAQFARMHARLRGEYLEPRSFKHLRDFMKGGLSEDLTMEDDQPKEPQQQSTVGGAWDVPKNGNSTPTLRSNETEHKSSQSLRDSTEPPTTTTTSAPPLWASQNFNVKVVFLVGQSESDYLHQRRKSQLHASDRSVTTESQPQQPESQRKSPGVSLFPPEGDVDPAFNVRDEELDELQARIVNESEVYGDIIQESFVDSYNNLTLKTIMMLKWVTNNCDGRETLPRRLQKDNKEYLQFRLDERDYSNDFAARMHVYVYGQDWVRTHQPYSPENVVNFTISKAVKPSITPEVGRYVGPVPSGAGRFIEFNITDMVQEWFENPRGNKYVLVETFNAFSEQVVADDPNGGKFVRYLVPFFPSRCSVVKYIMKCDDDTFVNVPNLLQVLLGGTVPVYRASMSFYDKNTINVKSTKNRLAEVKRLLTGFLFCEAKPIGDTSSKWYSPNYMYNKEFYPDYLSGTAYLMNLNAAKLLYRTSLTTPIFHLEDVYLTGIVADRVKLRRYHHPLFFYSTTKDLCSLRGMISQHQLQPGDLRSAYDFVSNRTTVCGAPDRNFSMAKMKLQQRKKCH